MIPKVGTGFRTDHARRDRNCRRSITSVTARPTGTSPAGCRATATFRSTTRAGARPAIAASCCATSSRAKAATRSASTTSRARCNAPPRRWNWRAPRWGCRPTAIIRDPRLMEIAFGDWEGSTIALLHQNDPVRISQREHDKWHFLPPGGESYEMCSRPHARLVRQPERRRRSPPSHGGTAAG